MDAVIETPDQFSDNMFAHLMRLAFPEQIRQRFKTWYHEHQPRARVSMNRSWRKIREQKQQWIFDYLQRHPCSCGEKDPVVLQFDHNEQDQKYLPVSTLISRAYALETLKAEVQKCTVRCANCHIRRTTKQLGWWKNGRP
jgi:hypothetical protein